MGLPAKKQPAGNEAKKKSGLIVMKPGDILFKENDPATSLFIIQSGQLRLFKPKGRGFVDLAILRAGEVIGEMAYFEEKGKGAVRSCSASAISRTELIEVSFNAFGKTLNNLNPWFKTIIETLAQRLRKTNIMVKELESNSVSSYGSGGKTAEYKFFKAIDIVKIFSVLFLVFKSHGEKYENGISVHMNTIKFYMYDIFNVQEIKFEEFKNILSEFGIIKFAKDKDGLPNLLVAKSVDAMRALLVFFNTQRITADDKQVKISDRGQKMMEAIYSQLKEKNTTGNNVMCDLSAIISWHKERNISLDVSDVEELKDQGFCGEPIISSAEKIDIGINYDKMDKMIDQIRIMNYIAKYNEKKANSSKRNW